VEGAPYVTSLSVMDKHNCDFCVHGDDIVTTNDGTDTYHEVKSAGRFRTVPRTQGVSTTQLVGRMLLLSKDHHSPYYNDRTALNSVPTGNLLAMTEGPTPKLSPYTGVGQYLPTSRRIVQFSEGREPKSTDKIVYIDGTFDLFHIGHVGILRQAKALGDFLIVGILPDDIVNQKKGFGWPVMNLHERVLSVLSCRYVDEVIIGAPWSISEEFVQVQKISIVARGSVSDPAYKVTPDEYDLAFDVPRKLGILKTIKSPAVLTTSDIVQRIIENRAKFVERNLKKEAKEVNELSSSQSSINKPPAATPATEEKKDSSAPKQADSKPEATPTEQKKDSSTPKQADTKSEATPTTEEKHKN
jgi:ethanolamine-phosphate cytidylyltransferase